MFATILRNPQNVPEIQHHTFSDGANLTNFYLNFKQKKALSNEEKLIQLHTCPCDNSKITHGLHWKQLAR